MHKWPYDLTVTYHEFHSWDRLQGIVASMSRIPTFRRRFRNLVKILYIEAIQASASSNHIGGITQHIHNKNGSAGTKDVKDRDGTVNVSAEKKPDIGDMVWMDIF